MLHFELSKIDKISQKDKTKFSVYCSSMFIDSKALICHFYLAQNIAYFDLKIYTMIEYNISYV
jgi:hypothetical protein